MSLKWLKLILKVDFGSELLINSDNHLSSMAAGSILLSLSLGSIDGSSKLFVLGLKLIVEEESETVVGGFLGDSDISGCSLLICL